MSLKSVELQIAIPRTGEAGNLQNQLLQKPIHDQAMLAAGALKQMEEQRKKSAKVNETSEHLKANSDGSRNQQYHIKGKSIKNKNEDSAQVEHPFKGHHIDLSL